MKKLLSSALCSLLIGLLVPAQTIAQTASEATNFTISGAVAQPLSLSAAELAKQPHVTIKAKDKQGKEHTILACH